jgi:outer membrane protein assembly factor BamB
MKPFSLLFALLMPMAATCQDAPMFRGNLAHTGVYNAAGVPTFSAVKWKFQTGGRVVSSPAVVAGVAYVGSTDGNL